MAIASSPAGLTRARSSRPEPKHAVDATVAVQQAGVWSAGPVAPLLVIERARVDRWGRDDLPQSPATGNTGLLESQVEREVDRLGSWGFGNLVWGGSTSEGSCEPIASPSRPTPGRHGGAAWGHDRRRPGPDRRERREQQGCCGVG